MDLHKVVEWWGTSCLDRMNNANSDAQALLRHFKAWCYNWLLCKMFSRPKFCIHLPNVIWIGQQHNVTCYITLFTKCQMLTLHEYWSYHFCLVFFSWYLNFAYYKLIIFKCHFTWHSVCTCDLLCWSGKFSK